MQNFFNMPKVKFHLNQDCSMSPKAKVRIWYRHSELALWLGLSPNFKICKGNDLLENQVMRFDPA